MFPAPRRRQAPLVSASLLVLLLGCSGGKAPAPGPHIVEEAGEKFWESDACGNCHTDLYRQFKASMHSKAFTNPVFQAQFYKIYLPRLHDKPEGYDRAPACLACHAPIAYMEKGLFFAKMNKAEKSILGDPECSSCHAFAVSDNAISGHTDGPNLDDIPREALAGVACDFCHRIEGYWGLKPGNGNYKATPGPMKFGPRKHETDWHTQYNELQTRGDFCGICHDTTNRKGVPIRTTYGEWQRSAYSTDGVQCQDCHMNAIGYLGKDGKPVFESGKVARLASAPERAEFFSHRFPGAHSETQLKDSLKVTIDTRQDQVPVGKKVRLKVQVDNTKAGHSVPTGSVELRSMWLDLTARQGDDEIPIRLAGMAEDYAVSGRGTWDDRVYGDQVPGGRRIYRTVFLDASGKQTLHFFDAVSRVFDNRLEAGEVRDEYFYLDVPKNAWGKIHLTARIFYLRYPKGFADELGIAPVEPLEVSRSTHTLEVH